MWTFVATTSITVSRIKVHMDIRIKDRLAQLLTFTILSTLSFNTFATKECETLQQTSINDLSMSIISSCRLQALLQEDIDSYVDSFESELWYLQIVDDFKTNEKLGAGLLDSSALKSFSLKYQNIMKAAEPYAEAGNFKAMALMYEILSGDGSFIGPLNTYKSMIEAEGVPNFKEFDALLDYKKSFSYLTRLAETNEKEYLKPLAEAYFDGIGTETNWGKGFEAVIKSTIQYDNEHSASTLAMKVIALGGVLGNNLEYLAVGASLIKYSKYLNKKDPNTPEAILDFETSFPLASMVRGYSKEETSNQEMLSMSETLYQQLVNRDFKVLNYAISEMIRITDASGM
jgi:hypothetical protein